MNTYEALNSNELAGMAPQMTVTVAVPICSKETFCEWSGMRAGQLRGQIDRDRVVLFRIGKKVFINVAHYVFNAVNFDGYSLVPVPLMTVEKFAQYLGVSDDWVRQKIHTNEIPGRQFGRLNMVDLGELFRMCLYTKPVAIH